MSRVGHMEGSRTIPEKDRLGPLVRRINNLLPMLSKWQTGKSNLKSKTDNAKSKIEGKREIRGFPLFLWFFCSDPVNGYDKYMRQRLQVCCYLTHFRLSVVSFRF